MGKSCAAGMGRDRLLLSVAERWLQVRRDCPKLVRTGCELLRSHGDRGPAGHPLDTSLLALQV